jgi:hypothetical protein
MHARGPITRLHKWDAATLIGEMVDRLDHGPLAGSCGGPWTSQPLQVVRLGRACLPNWLASAWCIGSFIKTSGVPIPARRPSAARQSPSGRNAPSWPGCRAGRPPRLDWRFRTSAASTGGNYGCLAVSVSGIIVDDEGSSRRFPQGSTRRLFAVSADLGARGLTNGPESATAARWVLSAILSLSTALRGFPGSACPDWTSASPMPEANRR